jgi:thiamine biosynthesis lipoprotein
MTCTSESAMSAELTARSFKAIGTTASVVVQVPDAAGLAEQLLADELEAIDLACSRFRADSELEMLHAHAGRPVVISELLFEALGEACRVAARTGGAVDPTVGNAIAALGYDADLDVVRARPSSGRPGPPPALGPVAGYGHIQLDADDRTVRIPRGVRLDLGSTAKALAADRAAGRIAGVVGSGVLVSLGGDVAVAGSPPRGGWAIGIAQESAAPDDELQQVVAVTHGGLASSATSARTWHAAGRQRHHVVDPRTGDCASPYWSLVSATGMSCVDANMVTTAALVWGDQAIDKLRGFDASVRLVRLDGAVFSVNGWPLERAS